MPTWPARFLACRGGGARRGRPPPSNVGAILEQRVQGVDRLADSLNGVTANASSDRIHIDNLTTQLRQVSDEKARIAVALDDAKESITRLTGENSALSDELKAASDGEAAALDQANEIATSFLDLDSALVEALSEQPREPRACSCLSRHC